MIPAKNLPTKGTLGITSAKDKMLEAEPILERNRTTHQGIKKYSFHPVIYTARTEPALFKLPLTHFLKRNKTFLFCTMI